MQPEIPARLPDGHADIRADEQRRSPPDPSAQVVLPCHRAGRDCNTADSRPLVVQCPERWARLPAAPLHTRSIWRTSRKKTPASARQWEVGYKSCAAKPAIAAGSRSVVPHDGVSPCPYIECLADCRIECPPAVQRQRSAACAVPRTVAPVQTHRSRSLTVLRRPRQFGCCRRCGPPWV